MAQAGIHALIGVLTRKILPKKNLLLLGVILGSVFPDLDNYAVAIATIAKLDPQGLHRSYTHSLLAIIMAIGVFVMIAHICEKPYLVNLGVGLGIGIGLHIILDLFLWFNGVELLWPAGGWVNLWGNIIPPDWLIKLMDPAEFLFFALYYVWLIRTAKIHKTNSDSIPFVKTLMIVMAVLFLIFTPLAFVMNGGFQIIFGGIYLISITITFAMTIRMRQTIEAFS